MHFNGTPLAEVGKIPQGIVSELADKLKKAELAFNYHTTLSGEKSAPWWCRIDASLRQDNILTHSYYPLVAPILNELTTLKLDFIKDAKLFAWSISRLNPKTKLDDHTDGILRFRFCDRIIVPLSNNAKSYNYYRNSDGTATKVYFNIGSVYRLNNLHVHGAVNDGDEPRDNILLDFIDPRICDKFINHPDFYSLISPGGDDIDRDFFKELLRGEARSYNKYIKG